MPLEREPLPAWFQWGLRAALYALLAFSVTGMLLAMADWFRPAPVAVLTLGGAAALLWLGRPGVEAPRSWSWVALGALVLAGASVVFNAHFSSEHVIADRDPGIYLWHGRWIADAGSLLVDSVDSIFSSLVGPQPAHCPSTCPGAPGGRQYVQFLHLFPLTLAPAQWIGGPALVVKTNAILGGLSLLAFFAFATRLVRPVLALAATAALAVNFVQVHFTRDSVSEVLAQVLLFGGLYLLWEARRRWDPRAAAVAGLMIGATCMVRIDSFFYLIPLALYLFGELAIDGPVRRRFVAAAAGGLATTAAIGLADLYFFSRPYFDFESDELGTIGIGLAATLLAGAAAVVAWRRAASIRETAARLRGPAAVAVPAAIAALAIFAAFVRPSVETATLVHRSPKSDGIIATKQRDQGLPVEPRRSYAEHTFVWLDWYLGPVALAAGVAGLALLTRLLILGRAGPAAPFLGIFLATSLLYLWRPSIFPDQVWAMRRFLPVVIPGLLVLSAWAAERLLAVRAVPRRLAPVAAAAVVAGSIAVPFAQLVPLRGERQQAGTVSAMEKVCRKLPPRAAVLAVRSPSIYQIVQPVRAFCQVPVGQLSKRVTRAAFARYQDELARRGRTVALIARRPNALHFLLGRRTPRSLVHIEYRSLEQRLARRPKHQFRQQFRLWLAVLD